MDKPVFCMMCGLPGSGKTTLALEMKKEFGYEVYSSDALREELYGDVNCQDHNHEVFHELRRRIIKDLKEGKSCVYDATNVNQKYRTAFLKDIENIECEKHCMVLVVPVEVCKEWNNSRDRVVPEEVYDKMLRSFWIPQEYEGWDDIYFLAKKDLKKKYPLEMKKARGFDQQNSYHTKDLFNHMYDTYKYIALRSPDVTQDLDLLYAALFHDIGKLYTRSFKDSKGRDTVEAHYYGHENYGAYLALVHGMYPAKEECDDEIMDYIYAAWLINWHMRPMVWEKSEKARERDRALIGEQRYKELMLLHEADVSAR